MKVGFVGAFCTANFGDWAMLVNNIKDIEPDEITVFCYNKKFPRDYVISACKNIQISFVDVELCEKEYKSKDFSPLSCVKSLSNYDILKKAVSDLDALCVSGGGYFDDNWCSRGDKFYKLAAPIVLARDLGVRTIFTAQGICPVAGLIGPMRLLFNYLDRSTPVALRDDYCSPLYAQEVFAQKLRTFQLPDDLLFINNELIKYDFDSGEDDRNQNYCVFVIHDKIEELVENRETICQIANLLKSKYDLSICLMPFDLIHYGYDQCKIVNEWLPDSSIISAVEASEGTISQVRATINGARFVVTTRYHPVVLAVAGKVPLFVKMQKIMNSSEYYYNKFHGLFEKTIGTVDEKNYFVSSWDDIYQMVSNSLEELIGYQNNMYNSKTYDLNMSILHKQRKSYFAHFFNREEAL